jgi:DNA-directed RNA polymerase subunit omega
MGYPLKNLIEYNANMYEITSAIIRRVYQLSVIMQPETDRDGEKIVSIAAKELFTKEVEYKINAPEA